RPDGRRRRSAQPRPARRAATAAAPAAHQRSRRVTALAATTHERTKPVVRRRARILRLGRPDRQTGTLPRERLADVAQRPDGALLRWRPRLVNTRRNTALAGATAALQHRPLRRHTRAPMPRISLSADPVVNLAHHAAPFVT